MTKEKRAAEPSKLVVKENNKKVKIKKIRKLFPLLLLKLLLVFLLMLTLRLPLRLLKKLLLQLV